MSVRCRVVAAVVLTCVTSGCSTGELEKQIQDLTSRAELAERFLADAQSRLAQVTAQSKSCESKSQQLTQENARLKETAQAYFAESVDLMSADTDAADNAAIAKLEQLLAKFPHDALAPSATARIAEINERIEQRAARLRQAQAKVRKLITACKRNKAAAKSASQSGLQFNYFGDLDMNAAVAASRTSDAYEKKAETAKTEARELLKSVPDPDGTLKAAVEECDQDDQ